MTEMPKSPEESEIKLGKKQSTKETTEVFGLQIGTPLEGE